jgi:hypothetical protein
LKYLQGIVHDLFSREVGRLWCIVGNNSGRGVSVEGRHLMSTEAKELLQGLDFACKFLGQSLHFGWFAILVDGHFLLYDRESEAAEKKW